MSRAAVKDAAAQAPPPAVREDLRRIGEHDRDFVRLKARTVKQLARSVGELVRALRRGGGDATATHNAVSDFLARHIAILQAAYEAGHHEGAKDYYGATSRTPGRYTRCVRPDKQVTQKRMAFYALPSVTRMAVEAQSALHATQLAKVVATHEARVQQLAVGLREMPLTEAEARELEDWIAHPRALPARPPRDLPPGDGSVALWRFAGEGGGSSVESGDALAQWQERLGARITLQADVVWSGLQDGYSEAGGGDPAYGYYSLIYWLLEPLATHCDDCLAMAADSPYNAPGLGGNTLYTTPGDGSTECGAACKCSLSYDAPGQIQDRLNDALANALSRWNLTNLADQIARVGTEAGYGGYAANVVTVKPSGPVGPEGEQLSDGQKGALDAYRQASDAWDLVRDNLPSFRDILSGELHDAPAIAEGTQLTPEQARVLERLVDALVKFAGAEGASESALRDDLAQAQARLDVAQQKIDDLNTRMARRGKGDFVSREEMHQANVEYVTARQEVEDAAEALGKTPEEIRELVGEQPGLEIRGPTAPLDKQIADLQAQREKFASQRETAQDKLDTLSERWVNLVLQQAEFDPEDDEEEIAAIEDKIAKVEQQQAAQLAKIEKLDQQIAAADGQLAEAKMPPSEREQMLRRQFSGAQAQRRELYAQQNAVLRERARLENTLERDFGHLVKNAEYGAKIDLYHASLDQADPEVKQYLKDLAARQKARDASNAARAEVDRLTQAMLDLRVAGYDPTAQEYVQAVEARDAAVAALQKADRAGDKAWQNLWTRSPGVYKPELDSIAGAENQFARMGLHFTPEEIAQNPRVLAVEASVAPLRSQIAEIDTQVRSINKTIADLNAEIGRILGQMRDLSATLDIGGEVADMLRPFSSGIDLPQGVQPPNALMQKLGYNDAEVLRAGTKSRIIDGLITRLEDNPAWRDYVSRMPVPRDLGIYNSYLTASATKSAKLVADLVSKWGIGYRPGDKAWVALQKAANEEFGLGATIHNVTDAQMRAGEALYAQNGPALRAFIRAMYDNTQQWFAENGITEVDVYRGFGWARNSSAVPKDVVWGPIDNQNYGIKEIELNPFQSFSADINISQGTFAGGGFGGGNAYSLVIGARVPVERVLSTAQSGFGAKRESEIVVLGNATDTVAYRAGTSVSADLLRLADEQAVGDGEMLYVLDDGTRVGVAANANGTFTLTYHDGPEGTLGPLKVGSSKTYKTEQSLNKALTSMRIANTYVAPAPEALAIREGEETAAARAATDGLTARIDNIPADATVADMEDYVRAQLPTLQRVDLMALDVQTARLVANATINLIQQLPEVADHLELLIAGPRPTEALAYVSSDGLSLILNSDKWLDLADLAANAPQWYADGWWVSQTPESILGHEIGHLVQVHYHISDVTWLEAMERVTAAGGNPIVSTYGVHNIKEAFAETFALLVYGSPTEAQLPIVRELAEMLSVYGIDYNVLRQSVGAGFLNLS